MIQADATDLTDFRLAELQDLLEVDDTFADEAPDQILECILSGACFEAPSSDAAQSKLPNNSPSGVTNHLLQNLDLSSLGSGDSGLRDVYAWLELPSSASEQSAVHDDIAGKTHAEARVSTVFLLSHFHKYKTFLSLQDGQALNQTCKQILTPPSRQASTPACKLIEVMEGSDHQQSSSCEPCRSGHEAIFWLDLSAQNSCCLEWNVHDIVIPHEHSTACLLLGQCSFAVIMRLLNKKLGSRLDCPAAISRQETVWKGSFSSNSLKSSGFAQRLSSYNLVNKSFNGFVLEWLSHHQNTQLSLVTR